MSLTDNERASIVQLRMDKAKTFLAEANKMVEMKLWDMAVNRFYYACFHAAQAAIVHFGFAAHTHAGTISVFGLNFVKTGKISTELGVFFSRMEQLRMKADYNCDYDVTQEDVESMIAPAHKFCDAIKEMCYPSPIDEGIYE